MRLRKSDGSHRWFLARCNPVRDDKGQVMRWYIACTDIEDRKRAEEKLQRENVALREEIDKASMFEEIVGTSGPLKAVLSRIAKVGSDQLHRSDYRGNRHRQRTHRPCRSQTIPEIWSSLHQRELCRASAHAGFLGIVWP